MTAACLPGLRVSTMLYAGSATDNSVANCAHSSTVPSGSMRSCREVRKIASSILPAILGMVRGSVISMTKAAPLA